MNLQALNIAEEDKAYEALLACCGSARWAKEMVDRRPFSHAEQLHATAQDIWYSLNDADWREAFSAHPQIGETRPVSTWSAQEQQGMAAADATIAESMSALNHRYKERFGYIFIVCATGKSAAEMHCLLENRLINTPQQELPIAAAEQMKITHLRLGKLLQQ
jgi:OHCU decarboxylase